MQEVVKNTKQDPVETVSVMQETSFPDRRSFLKAAGLALLTAGAAEASPRGPSAQIRDTAKEIFENFPSKFCGAQVNKVLPERHAMQCIFIIRKPGAVHVEDPLKANQEAAYLLSGFLKEDAKLAVMLNGISSDEGIALFKLNSKLGEFEEASTGEIEDGKILNKKFDYAKLVPAGDLDSYAAFAAKHSDKMRLIETPRDETVEERLKSLTGSKNPYSIMVAPVDYDLAKVVLLWNKTHSDNRFSIIEIIPSRVLELEKQNALTTPTHGKPKPKSEESRDKR